MTDWDARTIAGRLFNRRTLGQSGIYVAFVIVVVTFASLSEFFLTFDNFLNIGRQTAVLFVAAFAMTFVILSGEIDLSVGALASLVGVVIALLLADGWPLALALAAGLATGMAVGFVNGVLAIKGRIPSFIVTLGMFSALRGVSFLLTQSTAISINSDAMLTIFADAEPLGIPAPILFVVALFIGLHVLLTRTRFGAYVYAVGGNAAATRLSGINTDRIKIAVFALGGTVVAFAGILLTARLGTGLAEGARNLELDAIAAVVLGGTSFSGGRGSLVKTVMGALLIGTLNNGLTLLNISYFAQLIIKGAIIIAAVLLDQWTRRER